jgi:hypothetical protein
LHDVHDPQRSKLRSSGHLCDFSRACARRSVGRARQLPRCGHGGA